MTEREARGLAAELDNHRWWRVESVRPALQDWCYGDWWVRLRHRQTDALFIVMQCESPEHLQSLAACLHINGPRFADPDWGTAAYGAFYGQRITLEEAKS